jgi:endonuclease III
MKKEIIKVIEILSKDQGKTMLAKFQKKYSPFKILISAILSARAKDEVTEKVSEILFRKYPTAERLSKASLIDIKKIIKPLGFYNVKAKNIKNTAKKILKNNNKVPDEFDDLLKLDGVGRKVASCVLVYAYEKTAIPVDTHVNKIANRLGWVKTKNPFQTELELKKIVPEKYHVLLNDVFVAHGKSICKSRRSVDCSVCPVEKFCKKVGVNKVH